MKKIKIKLALVFILSLSYSVYAQQKGAHISFKNQTHNFGTIDEAGGNVTHKFEFTNTGSTPLVITNVKASCGCTTSNWTKSPVSSGSKGYVAATFNPKGRPGKFKKSITVISSADNPTFIIYIAGEVVPKLRSIQDDYPRQIGPIRVETDRFSFTKVFKGEIKNQRLNIINVTEEPVTISFENVPSYISLKTDPEQLKPNEKGVIIGSYDAVQNDNWGFVNDRIRIISNGERTTGTLSISANITEDFSKLTVEELKNAPRIEFEENNFDFGTIKQQTKVEHKYAFTNTGKNDLIIRKIRASCGCTTVNPEKSIISPGESSSVTAIFDAGRRKGRQNKTITIITNDPINSTLTIRLSGSVEESTHEEKPTRP